MSNTLYLEEGEVEKAVNLYRDYPSTAHGKALGHIFQILAQTCIKYAKLPKQAKMTEKNCVYACFDKVNNFNPSKGKAFNYFTTIILNQMRREYRAWKSIVEKKKKYGYFLA